MLNRKNNYSKHIYGYNTRLIAFILVFAIILSSVFTGGYSVSAETPDSTSSSKTTETSAPEEPYIIGEDIERRGENEKHFLMSDGTRVATMYDTAVHYLDESGEYQEIDNSFESTENDEYQTKKGKNKVKLAKKASAKKLVTLHTDDYKISWSFEDAKKVKAQIVEENSQADDDFAAKNINGKMNYVDAFENVDLEYIVKPDGIKENIILKSKNAQNEFAINYDVGKLTAVQKDSRTIELLDGETAKYTISAPVMIDSNNETSTDLSITLTEQKNGKLTVVVSADSKWLSDSNRVYPVIVDPSISSTQTSSTLQCKFTYSATGSGIASYANSFTDLTFVGYHPQLKNTTSLYRFTTLPTVSAGDYITDARLGLAGQTNPGIQINAYESSDLWFDNTTLPLDYESEYYDEVLDYVDSNSSMYYWNITSLVRKWYNFGVDHYDNCGIVLKADSATSDYITFANSSYSDVNARPVLVLSYVNLSGIESYLSYTSISAGGGTAYINNATGNMTLELPVIATKGENLPASLALYYNITQAGQQGISKIGAGWRTNFDQKVTIITNSTLLSNGYKYTYVDADGTCHYMKTVEGKTNEYQDELGKGLTLKYENNAFTLTDKEGNICYFNYYGYLTKQKAATSPSVITLTYDSSNKLSSVTDGAGDKLTFERNSNGFITAIVDNYERKINLSYTSSNLGAITYYDGTKVSFGYSSENFLTSAVDAIGMRTEFQYNTSSYPGFNGRMNSVCEKSKDGLEEGDRLAFFYDVSGATMILSSGTVTSQYYVFDEFGRSVSAFSDNGSASAVYTEKDNNASYKNNKISKTTSTGSPVENLAFNTNYESSFWWNTYVSSTGNASAEVVSEEKRLGQSSLKLTANNRGCTTYYQKFTPKKSGYYTYSVYYKTDGLEAEEGEGAKAFIAYIDYDGNKNYVFSEPKISSTNGEWKRLSVTYYCDISKIKQLHIANGLFFSYSGSVYFDCAQFEYSKSANKYNMISNGMFNLYTSGWNESGTDFYDGVEDINNQYYVGNPPRNIENSFIMYSNPTDEKRIYQTININLPANKVALNFSAYAIAKACKESDFALELTFNYSDGTKEIQSKNFNYKCYVWQYLTELFVPKEKSKTVATVKASLKFSGKANSVEFTGAQLLVDTTGKMYTYDDKGNVITALDTADNAVSSVYDDENRLTSKTLQDGSVFTYDYLNNSNVSTKLIASQTAPNNQKTDFTYNSFGQQTSSTLYNSTNPNGLKITSSANYSSNGKYLNSETDSLGNTIRYVYSTEIGGYDLLDRVYSNSNDNSFTEYTYDAADRVIKTTANDGNQATASVDYTYEDNTLSKITHNGFDYNFEYDNFGNTTKISVGNKALVTNTYSRNSVAENGNTLTSPHLLTKSTYGNGDYVEYKYDNQERVIGKRFNGALKYTYVYDSDGNIYQVKDVANDITYTYYYDNLGRVENICGYKGFDIYFTYDGSNRITDEHYTFNGNTESVHHNYDAGGVITSSEFSDGSVQSYTYDSLMRTSSVTTKVSENSTQSWIASYGFLNPTEETTTTLVNSITYNAINLNFSYTYDNLGNITEIKENNVLKASYEYDYLNQLTRENNAYLNKTVTYNYDTAGNILSKTYYNYTLGSLDGLTGNVVQYTYGDSNWKDKLTAYNGNAITYDEIGNPLSYYNGLNFTWKNGRNLSKVTMLNGKTATYVYNESGIRIYKQYAGTKTFFHLNGSQIAAMQVDNTLYNFSYDGAGQLYSINFNGETYYYFFNVQGDVIGLYDSNLNVVVRYTYDSWGKLLSTTGTLAGSLGVKNPFRYRGYYYDTETGFYYVSSRYYDPEIGRFINADAAIGQIGNVQGTNMFAYCFNNPVNMSDPTGNWPKLSTIFKVVAVAAAVVAVAAVCVATAGLATVAVAGGGTMLVATATTTAALGVAATAGKVALAATGAAAVSEIAEKTYDNLPRNHTVYGLQNPSTGKIEYVGRTTDPAKRAAAHKNNTARQHLEMVPLATGLNAIEARGVEQIQMLAHHTINTANKMNNQINGISPFNRKLGVYMEAGRGALSYLENQISNEILYWTGN